MDMKDRGAVRLFTFLQPIDPQLIGFYIAIPTNFPFKVQHNSLSP
jgi:hypothetical protein